jgi:hypothetical protein
MATPRQARRLFLIVGKITAAGRPATRLLGTCSWRFRHLLVTC